MAGRKRGSVLWSHHVQALVTEDVNNAVRTYAKDWHNGSISTAARVALTEHLKQVGYLDKAA
jgi:hypothetical protein